MMETLCDRRDRGRREKRSGGILLVKNRNQAQPSEAEARVRGWDLRPSPSLEDSSLASLSRILALLRSNAGGHIRPRVRGKNGSNLSAFDTVAQETWGGQTANTPRPPAHLDYIAGLLDVNVGCCDFLSFGLYIITLSQLFQRYKVSRS